MTLQEIENSITKMTAEELARFRAWFQEFDANKFDARIAADANAGRLDELAAAALREHENGETKEL